MAAIYQVHLKNELYHDCNEKQSRALEIDWAKHIQLPSSASRGRDNGGPQDLGPGTIWSLLQTNLQLVIVKSGHSD